MSQCLVTVSKDANNLGGQGGKALAAGKLGRAVTTKNVRRETERWIRMNKVAAAEVGFFFMYRYIICMRIWLTHMLTRSPYPSQAKTGDEDAELAAEEKMLNFLKSTLTVSVIDARTLDEDAPVPELISIADLAPKRPDCCAAWCCAGVPGCKKSVGPQPKDIKGYVSDLAFMGILALFNSGAGQDKLDVPTLLNISKVSCRFLCTVTTSRYFHFVRILSHPLACSPTNNISMVA